MDDRHPKRRKDKYNPYTLSLVDGKCYLSFKDGQGFPHKLELDVKLYALFMNPYRHRHFEKESGGCRKSRKEGCRCISLMDSPTKKLRNGKDAAIKRYRSP